MSFPLPAWLTDVALFLLRLMVGIVFITSGYGHLKHPNARSKSIGMSQGFTIFLGAAELAGGDLESSREFSRNSLPWD
jgi:putative oxidoreductase